MDFACLMQEEDLSTLPEQHALITDYDPKTIQDLFHHLSPEKAAYVLFLPKGEQTRHYPLTEEWMEVAYDIEDLPEHRLQKWQQYIVNSFELPSLNPYFPENLEIDLSIGQNPLSASPQKISLEEPATLHLLPDTSYQLPHLFTSWEISTPAITKGMAQEEVLGDLYVAAAEQRLASLKKDATKAGMFFSLSRNSRGLVLTLGGYRDKTLPLLNDVLQRLASMTLTADLFNSLHENLSQRYENAARENPFQQTLGYLLSLIYKESTLPAQRLEAIQQIDQKKWEDFLNSLYKKVHVKAIFYGDIQESQAQKKFGQLYATPCLLRRSAGKKKWHFLKY